ncbi:MAG: hypothetical protein R3B09_18360 [Nannocystaceae bacterium]
MSAWLLDHFGLAPLDREAVPPGGEVLRILYAPTFHRGLVIVVRGFDDVAELEVLEEEAPPQRVMIAVDEAAAMIARLPASIDAFDRNSRDGIAAYAERWDGEALRIAEIGNPSASADAIAYQLLVAGLDLVDARLSTPRIRERVATLRRYLDDVDEAAALCLPGQTRARRRRGRG